MYNSNIILQIQAIYNQLTKAEKKVADYVLKQGMKCKKTFSLSMSEKAEEKGMLGKVDSLPRKMMKINMSAMKGTYMLMDHQNMIKIVRMIEKVRRVFFGIGYSPLAAEET